MDLAGSVMRLQVQRSSLKLGERPHRWFDPAPILSVPAIELAPGGVIGGPEDAAPIIDVHNETHDSSKNRDRVNSVSLGFISHYAAMRQRLGDRVTLGIAGENILIALNDTDRIVTLADLAAGLLIEAADGEWLPLTRIIVAAPCVEFSRYAIAFPDDAPPDQRVTETLQFLDHGMRGYYAAYHGSPRQIRLGARVAWPDSPSAVAPGE